jgi:hypothetical protein
MTKITNENHPELKCPVCGNILIHENDEKDGKLIDCKWRCIYPSCRGMELEFPVYYGYTQEDINNQERK